MKRIFFIFFSLGIVVFPIYAFAADEPSNSFVSSTSLVAEEASSTNADTTLPFVQKGKVSCDDGKENRHDSEKCDDKDHQTNHPPVFEAVGPFSVAVNDVVRFMVAAHDEDGDPLFYTAASIPLGAQFDPQKHVFLWQPKFSNVGVHEAVFRVTDKNGVDSEDVLRVEITVSLEAPQCDAKGYLFGTYFNLPKDHPDVETEITGVVTGTTPFAHDWFSEKYLSFTRNDEVKEFKDRRDYFPVDDGLPGDPFYFAVHWRGSLHVDTADLYDVSMGSDDDSWLYVNGIQQIDLGGIHPFSESDVSLDLSAGTSTIDIYFAERHVVESGFIFDIKGRNGKSITFSPCTNGIPMPENRPPVFTGPTFASTTVSSTLQFIVTVSDLDGDPLLLAMELPTGAMYATSTGIFAWTPSSVGTSTARFFASDGKSTTTHEVLIEVFERGGGGGGNLAPVFVNFHPPITATATEKYVYDAEATDPENDPLVFSLITFPEGMVIASTTGIIEWTPVESQATSTPYLVVIGVSDPTHVATTSYAIFVHRIGENIPPKWIGPKNVTGTVNVLVGFVVTASDPDGDPLLLTMELPTGATYSTSTGMFTWTPTVSGTSTAKFFASDGKATSTHEVLLEVSKGGSGDNGNSNPPGNSGGGGSFGVPAGPGGGGALLGGGATSTPNRPPEFIRFDPPRTATATWLYLYDAEATDPENDPLTFSLINAPRGMGIVSITGFIYWMPTIDQATSTPYEIIVQVSDGKNTTRTSYSIIVNAPAINSAPLQITKERIPLGVGGILNENESPKDISIQSSTVSDEATETGGQPLGARLLAGLFALFGGLLNWITANFCIIGYLLWLATLIAFGIYVFSRRNKEEENQRPISDEESLFSEETHVDEVLPEKIDNDAYGIPEKRYTPEALSQE